ncbi:hypothetical protein DAI22_05g040800 [Oryza sativa Japonica Group]|nr:hypothetical protein DAI22_05g040800 [Oryza sativa Japonica Group]
MSTYKYLLLLRRRRNELYIVESLLCSYGLLGDLANVKFSALLSNLYQPEISRRMPNCRLSIWEC